MPKRKRTNTYHNEFEILKQEIEQLHNEVDELQRQVYHLQLEKDVLEKAAEVIKKTRVPVWKNWQNRKKQNHTTDIDTNENPGIGTKSVK